MTIKQSILFGAAIGFVVSSIILVLLWFGVSGILRVGSADLMYVLWPASIIMSLEWRSTPLGIVITLIAVVMNCGMYAAGLLVLRAIIRWLTRN